MPIHDRDHPYIQRPPKPVAGAFATLGLGIAVIAIIVFSVLVLRSCPAGAEEAFIGPSNSGSLYTDSSGPQLVPCSTGSGDTCLSYLDEDGHRVVARHPSERLREVERLRAIKAGAAAVYRVDVDIAEIDAPEPAPVAGLREREWERGKKTPHTPSYPQRLQAWGDAYRAAASYCAVHIKHGTTQVERTCDVERWAHEFYNRIIEGALTERRH